MSDSLLIYKQVGKYTIGSASELSLGECQQMVTQIELAAKAEGQKLEGRAVPISYKLEGVGQVIIKRYLRGGILRFINDRWYLNIGRPRSEIEFVQSRRAREFGVSVPEPVAFIFTRSIFYQAYYVSREIEGAQSAALLSATEPSRVAVNLNNIAAQIVKLVSHNLLHSDLHPGNVLIGSDNKIWLIDFDKAIYWKGDKRSLMRIYLNRWRRAVLKHDLPDFLVEAIALALRVNDPC